MGLLGVVYCPGDKEYRGGTASYAMVLPFAVGPCSVNSLGRKTVKESPQIVMISSCSM